jgi:hypothetical protein
MRESGECALPHQFINLMEIKQQLLPKYLNSLNKSNHNKFLFLKNFRKL